MFPILIPGSANVQPLCSSLMTISKLSISMVCFHKISKTNIPFLKRVSKIFRVLYGRYIYNIYGMDPVFSKGG